MRIAALSISLLLIACACRDGAKEPNNDPKPAATPPSVVTSEKSDPSAAAAPSAAGSKSPEDFASTMIGTIACGKEQCRAGKQVCVATPNPDDRPNCQDIGSWVDKRTPKPRDGFPAMAGITACSGSHNCPEGSVCCLHEIGLADVQAVVCHASLDECRDRVELCEGKAKVACRTPGTRCVENECRQ